MLRGMSEASEAPPRTPAEPVTPQRVARWARRFTVVIGVVGLAWFLLKFESRWVPPGRNTNPDIPPGSWVLLDRYASGLQVGSDVLIDTPHGELISRVSALDAATVTIRHPDPLSTWGDSQLFGALPREQIVGTVVVTLPPSDPAGQGR